MNHSRYSNALILFWLLVFALFAHFVFLTSNGVYWDGLGYYPLFKHNQFHDFFAPWSQNGRPLHAYIYWFIGYTLSQWLDINTIAAFHVTVVLSIFISAGLLFTLLTRYAGIKPIHATLMAMLSMLYPALQANLSYTTSIYTYCLSFLLLGIFLGLKSAEYNFHQARSWLYRIGSLLSLAFGCIAEATLPLVLAVPILIIFYQNQFTLRHSIHWWGRHLLKKIDYLLLPIGYYLAMIWLMPTSGSYVSARDISLNPLIKLKLLMKYIAFFIPVTHSDLINLLFLLLLTTLLVIAIKKNNPDFYTKKLLGISAVALIAFVLSISTTLLANRGPAAYGWGMRQEMLAAIPFGILVISYIFITAPALFSTLKHLATLSIIAVFTYSVARINVDYFIWNGRSALDEAARQQFAANTQLKKASIIFIEKKYPYAFKETYRYYEWQSLIEQALGGYKRLAISTSPYNMDTLLKTLNGAIQNHFVKNFDIKGCQIKLNLTKNDHQSFITLGIKYWWHQLTSPTKSPPDWLNHLITISTENLKNCT